MGRQQSVHELLPPNRSLGRFFAAAGTEVVELGLVNATIHQVDERVDAADVDRLSAIYDRIGTACLGGPSGLLVGCAVAVNAVGDLLDPVTGRRVAGTRVAPGSSALADGDALLLAMPRAPDFGGLANTTLACVITNAALSREVLVHVAAHVHDGLARVLSPVHTRFDGDLAIACSRGDVAAAPDAVAVLARRAAMHAVMEAVRSATGLGGVPSAGELGLVIPDPGAW